MDGKVAPRAAGVAEKSYQDIARSDIAKVYFGAVNVNRVKIRCFIAVYEFLRY